MIITFSFLYFLFNMDTKFTVESVLYKALLFLAFKGEAGNHN